MSTDDFAALEHATPIVRVADGVATTTSMRIANGTHNEHRAVLQLIRDNLADFEEFGRVAFEMQPFDTAGGMQQRNVAILTEEHATLLLTYMRNSDIVRDFKKRLVREFWELRRGANGTPAIDANSSMRNTPYQQYMHHFEVIAHEYERSNGEIGCSYTTYVQPSGINFIRKRLGLLSIDPLPVGGA